MSNIVTRSYCAQNCMIPSMRKLILNADDLGISDQRTHGIFLCHEQGILTSASLIPNFPGSLKAGRVAQHRHLPLGLHLNLTTGSPMSTASDIASLITVDGYFLGRDTLERVLMEEQVNLVHIERELRVQIEWFLETFGQPTHIDSHHHMHIHPAIVPILIPLLDRYGIAFIRIPSEPHIPFGYQITPVQSAFIKRLSELAEKARKMFAANGISSTDNFRGLAFSGNASKRNFRHILSRLPEGTTEFMMHPGSPNPHGEAYDSDPQRQTEMNVLLDTDVLKELSEREITLCSWADLF